MNRFIAEKVMGKCWHERKGLYKCSCGISVSNEHWPGHIGANPIPNYSTGKDKAALMDKCVGEEWWETSFIPFMEDKWRGVHQSAFLENSVYAYLWRNLPQLVAEYHGYKRP